MRSGVSYRLLLLVGVLSAFMFSLNTFVMLPAALVSDEPQQLLQSAFGTFPGENGKIAFGSMRDGTAKIYVMNGDGSNVAELTTGTGPDWSPDGKKIVFADSRDRFSGEIYVMNADGSEQIRLTNNNFKDGEPKWSPDGTKIAFASDRDDVSNDFVDIYVMNADGSEQIRLTNSRESDYGLSWSPDGKKIVFTSQRTGDSSNEIYVMNADGSEQIRLTNNPGQDVEPDWSPDGTKIAFHNNENGPDIYVMDADGSRKKQLTSDNDNLYDYSPRWSPDGTKIVFGRSVEHRNGEIYVMNADGSEQINISNNPAADFSPDWGSTGVDVAPLLNLPEDIIAEAPSESGGTQVTYTVTAQDDYDGTATLEEDGSTITQDDVGGDITISCEPPSGSVFPIGETIVECTATDSVGNSARESFIVPVYPQRPDPTITITEKDCSQYPDFIYFRYVVEGLPRTVSDYVIFTFTTGDGTETTINEGWTRGLGETGSTGGANWMSPGGLGPYTVTYHEATGPSNPEDATAANIVPLPGGIQVSTTFTCEIVEEDTTPPAITVPEDIVVEATNANGGTIVTYNVTAEDNVDGTATVEEDGSLTQDDDGGDILISCDPASGTEFPIGETIVECSATDTAGNSNNASFMVTVNPPPPDTTAPTLTVPEDMSVEATGPDGAQVSFEEEPSATDNIDGPVDVNCNYNSGDTFPIGVTVVSCSAEDSAGNRAEESFTITVQDTTAPDVEITQVVDRRNRVLEEGDTTPTPYIRVTFEATDAVGVEDTECSLDGQTFTFCTSPVVYDRLSRGIHEFTVRATDEAGNVGEDEFTWTVGANPSAAAPGRQ